MAESLSSGGPEAAAQEKDRLWGLNDFVAHVLPDAPRPGKPRIFTAEPVAHVIARSCDPPKTMTCPCLPGPQPP